MSIRVTHEAFHRSFCLFIRSSSWRLLRTPPVKDNTLKMPLNVFRGQNQTRSLRSLVSPVRFYSPGRILSEEPQEKDHLAAHPPETQTSLEHRRKGSPFYDRLQRCGSPSDVLDLTCQYSPTVRQLSNCFTQMWETTKKMSGEQKHYELQLIFEHPAFDKLLQRAMKSVGSMRIDDVAYSLLGMIKLGVPQRSRVVQTYLRACQEKLDEFDERGLSIVASCLEHMDRDQNVDALKHGMRLIVESRLPEIQNVMALQIVMRLLGKDAPLDLKQRLERKALSLANQFSLPNAQHMISTMATMGFYSKPLLEICSQKITENLHGIPFNRLFKVLQACKELHYRDLKFLTDISDYIASSIDIWTKKQVVLFLSVFESLAFCPTALMDTFTRKVIEIPDALTLRDLLCILKVYSSLNHNPQHHRQQFLDSISQAVSYYLPKMSAHELLKTVYYLCLLDHFPTALLESLLQSSTLDSLSMTAPKFLSNQERMLQTVHLCLSLDRPVLPQPLTVPLDMLGDPASRSPTANPQLLKVLHCALAAQPDTVLQEMVVVKRFYHIDAVITHTLQKQSFAGQPGSAAEDSKRIAVLCTSHSAFSYGTSNPRGPLAVKIRHLKLLGYDVVLVMEQELQSVSEENGADLLRARIFPEHNPPHCPK